MSSQVSTSADHVETQTADTQLCRHADVSDMFQTSFVFITHQCVFSVCVSLIFSGVNLGASSQFSDFLDGLGPAQLVGRQTLATPAIGEISTLLRAESCLLCSTFFFSTLLYLRPVFRLLEIFFFFYRGQRSGAQNVI